MKRPIKYWLVIQVWGQKEKEDSIKGRKWERENEAQIQEGAEGCHQRDQERHPVLGSRATQWTDGKVSHQLNAQMGGKIVYIKKMEWCIRRSTNKLKSNSVAYWIDGKVNQFFKVSQKCENK